MTSIKPIFFAPLRSQKMKGTVQHFLLAVLLADSVNAQSVLIEYNFNFVVAMATENGRQNRLK